MTGTQCLLCEMLSCGIMDLELLDRVGYNWDEILDQAEWPSEGFDFNGLMRAVVSVGIIHIKGAVSDRICELEAIELNERELDDDEFAEKRALEELDPDNDIRSYHNCLDTHVWFERNGPIYRRYLAGALDSFENNVGFFLTGGESDD